MKKANSIIRQQDSIVASFKTDEKINAFDQIGEHYFQGNFGTMSKTDLEILLFTILINQRRANNLNIDDYTLSKLLGITQSRVRSFKQRSQLQYPVENPWQKEFVSCIKNAKYDEVKHLVKLNIPEVNVMIELRHFLEERGWFDEYQLNPKLFQCRLDIFVLICKELDTPIELDKDTKEKIEEFKKELAPETQESLSKIITGQFQDGLFEFVKKASIEVVCEFLNLLPFGGLAKNAIKLLIEVIKK